MNLSPLDAFLALRGLLRDDEEFEQAMAWLNGQWEQLAPGQPVNDELTTAPSGKGSAEILLNQPTRDPFPEGGRARSPADLSLPAE